MKVTAASLSRGAATGPDAAAGNECDTPAVYPVPNLLGGKLSCANAYPLRTPGTAWFHTRRRSAKPIVVRSGDTESQRLRLANTTVLRS
jgi:hypothetical protein